MVSLLHTNATGDFFLYAGLAVVPGNAHESPVFWKMVDDFVAAVGKGVIRLDASHAEPMRLREAKRQRTLARQRQELGVPEPIPPSQWIAKTVRSVASCIDEKPLRRI